MENIAFHERFYIRPVSGKHVERFIIQNHYAQRMPVVCLHIFGIFIQKTHEMFGCMSFGLCPSASLQGDCPYKIIELSRIALKNNEKNLVSWWMMQCISMLEKPLLLISFADGNQNHVGYVYQATNWIYTGESAKTPMWIVDGRIQHNKHMARLKKISKNIQKIETLAKHRYFYPLGNKKQKKEMREYIKNRFGIFPYPKADSIKYDMDLEQIKRQKLEGIKGFGL